MFLGAGDEHGRVTLVDGATHTVTALPSLPLDGGWLAESTVAATRDWVLLAAAVCPQMPVEDDAGFGCDVPDRSVDGGVRRVLYAFDRRGRRWITKPYKPEGEQIVAIAAGSGATFEVQVASRREPGPQERSVRLSTSGVVIGSTSPPSVDPDAPRCENPDGTITFDRSDTPTMADVESSSGQPAFDVPLPAAARRIGDPGLERLACVSAGHFLLLTKELLLFDLSHPERPPVTTIVGSANQLYAEADRWIVVPGGSYPLYVGRDDQLVRRVAVGESFNVSPFAGGVLLVTNGGSGVSALQVVPYIG